MLLADGSSLIKVVINVDKTIDVSVNGSYLRKNSFTAGVQGEGNAAILHITFDDSWAEMAKSVTFWNSRGENPVIRMLTADLLADISKSLLEYNVPIPAEPMAYEGKLTFVIDGYIDGVRMRSTQDKLTVIPALMADDAGEPADPVPTQAEQLQAEIESILPSVQAETIKAQQAASAAESEAGKSEGSALAAQMYAKEAEGAKEYAENAKSEAQTAQNEALLARSYAVGGTGTRAGENADNAKYYSEVAKSAVGGDFVTNTELNEAVSGLNEIYVHSDGSRPMTGMLEINALGLSIQKNNPNVLGGTELRKDASGIADYGTGLIDYDEDGGILQLNICSKNKRVSLADKDGNIYDVFSGLKKPTADDVGALSALYEVVAEGNDILQIAEKANESMINFTNWTDSINFPAKYGSGVVLGCFDQSQRHFIYTDGTEQWFGGYNSSTGVINWIRLAKESDLANKAPMYSYGTADLEAGVTALETGKLYLVYEE